MNFKEQLFEPLQAQAGWKNVFVSDTSVDIVQSIIQRTFLWMWAITALVFGTWYYMLYLIKTGVIDLGTFQVLFWIALIGWFLLVIAISFGWTKFSYATLAILFVLFGLLEWVWLTWILAVYKTTSVINAFAGAGVMFLVAAVWWYTTKTDLTKFGSLLLIWLVSIIVLSLLNVFLFKSSWFDLVLSIIGLVIFLALTAFDLQTLKMAALTQDRRVEIIFGLGLYLNFINIFITLLRIFGDRE